jgi:hypothetical protein
LGISIDLFFLTNSTLDFPVSIQEIKYNTTTTETMTDRKRQISSTSDADLDSPNLNTVMTRNIVQQKKKLSKFHLELEQLGQGITDQTPCTSNAVSTNTPIDTFFDHSPVSRSQPMDIQYPIAPWRKMRRMEAVKRLPSYEDAILSSSVASEPQDLHAADADNQNRPIDMTAARRHPWTAETHKNTIQHEIEQPTTSPAAKPSDLQKETESGLAVALLFKTLRELFIYANAIKEDDDIERPELQHDLMNLYTLTDALCDRDMYQSDATSMIAYCLSSLMESVTVEACRGLAEDYSSTLQLVVELNRGLQECYNWDPEKARFLGPLDVEGLNNVLTYFTLNFSSSVHEGYVSWRLRVDQKSKVTQSQMLRAVSNMRRLEHDRSQRQSSQEARDDMLLEGQHEQSTVQRTCMDEGMNYVPEDDPVEFLWSDPEDDEDNDQYDETDGSETASVDGIFDSATEISGADVTENDWSELEMDRESD